MKKIILALFTICFLFTSFSFTLAADEGIQISPLSYNFEINPGESKKAVIKVTNKNTTGLNYITEIELFDQVSESGAPSFAGVKKPEGITTLTDWVNFKEGEEKGILKPGEKKELNFTISVPKGAEPGGHYAGVFVKQIKKTESGETQLGVSSRVGLLLLVSVPGDINREVKINSINIPKFIVTGPINLQSKVENTGNIHYDSNAKAEIKNTFGRVHNIDLGTHTIIPKNIRDFQAKWNNRFPFGYYKVKIIATDGEKGTTTAESYFFALPLLIVIPILIIILLIILMARYAKKHIKIVSTKDKN